MVFILSLHAAETCPLTSFVALLPPVDHRTQRHPATTLCALGAVLALSFAGRAHADPKADASESEAQAPPDHTGGPSPGMGGTGATSPDGPPTPKSVAEQPPAESGSHQEGDPTRAPEKTAEPPDRTAPVEQRHAKPKRKTKDSPPSASDQTAETVEERSADPGVPTTARVELHVDRPGAWLETRGIMDESDWKRACDAPCGRRLLVDGMEARVQAPGMATSNVFRIQPGAGTARIKVNSGSSTARTAGVIGLTAGLPVAMAGLSAYGVGRVSDKATLQTVGVVVLVVGSVAALGSLPLLTMGTTTVRDADGHMIAQASSTPRF